MLVYGARTEIEDFGHIAVRFAAGDPQQHFRLARGQRQLASNNLFVAAEFAFDQPQQIFVAAEFANE